MGRGDQRGACRAALSAPRDSIFKQPSNLSYPSPARGEGSRHASRMYATCAFHKPNSGKPEFGGGGWGRLHNHPPRRFAPTSPFRGGIRKQARAIVPILCGAGYAVFRFPLCRAEGVERQAAHQVFSSRVPFRERGRLSALHRGVFLPAPGRAFGAGFLSQGLSAFQATAPEGKPRRKAYSTGRPGLPSASSWQGPVVVPGGAPAPPGCGGYVSSPARRRRALLHLRNVSRRRPQ